MRIGQLETTRRLGVGGDRPVNGNHGLFSQTVKLRTYVLVTDDDLRETTAIADDQE